MESWTKEAEKHGERGTTPATSNGGTVGTVGTVGTAMDAASTAPAAASPAEFYRSRPVLDRRVYVMGVGNVGSFIAHSIRGVPNPPPVTLLFPSRERLNAWHESPQRLSLVTEGDTETRDGYDAELAVPRVRFHGKEVTTSAGGEEAEAGAPQTLEGESTAPISSLIVCSKAHQVLQGLSAVKHRLHRDSVILFLQNGMGVADQVTRELFPDPATRPHYMLGINSHGMHTPADAAPFTTVHAGFGTIALGLLPHERDRDPAAPYTPRDKLLPHNQPQPQPQPAQHSPPPAGTQDDDVRPALSASVSWTPYQRYLLRTLLRVPVLAATAFSPPDLLQMQLEKLAVNCVINPLTVLLDARNGALLYNYNITRTMRLLLAEISLVFRSLPELQYLPNISSRFDPGRLETLVIGVAKKTESNISSTLADARRGRQTEIEFLNGWVVRRGEELGIRCTVNYALACLVKGKQGMIEREVAEGVPLVSATMDHKGGVVVREGVAQASRGEEGEREKSDGGPTGEGKA